MEGIQLTGSKIRILILSQYFWPEPFKISELANELSNSNLEVTVVTSVPNYPDGVVYEQYRNNPQQFEKLGNVEIIRVWQYPRGKYKLQLLLNYITFLIFASIELIKLLLRKQRYHIVLAAQLSPITSVIPAIFFSKMVQAKLIYWVFDLWPDSVISKRGLLGLLYVPAKLLCGVIYRRAKMVCITSRGFTVPLAKMGVGEAAMYYLPQWAENLYEVPSNSLTWVDQFFSEQTDKINVVFAGNIGTAQNLTEVIEAIKISEVKSRYNFVFVGSGRMLNNLKALCANYDLGDTVKFAGRQPPENLSAFYAKADLLLLSLKSNSVFDLTLPAKLQAYMVVGKPLMIMASGEANSIVKQAQCGYSCVRNDRYGYADLLKVCASASRKEMELMGENAQIYGEKYFKKEKIIGQFVEKLNDEISSI